MALPEVQVQAVDGGLGMQPEGAAGTHAKVGVCSAGGSQPLVLSGPSEVRAKLGYGPLANACIDSFANGAKTIIAMPASAGVAGDIGDQVTEPHVGSGSMVASGTPADAFDVLVEIQSSGELNEATFRFSLDGGDSWSDVITVPLGGSYVLPHTGLTITFSTGPSEAAGASVAGGVAPFNLVDGANLFFAINGSVTYASVGIQATPAVAEGSAAADFEISEGWTLKVNAETITFHELDFVDFQNIPASEMAEVINEQAETFLAEVYAINKIRLRSLTSGTGATIEVVDGGTAHGALGLSTGTSNGLGNVANVSAVTFEELQTLIQLASPAVGVTQGVGGQLVITTHGTGPSASIQVVPGTHPAFGLDQLLHVGTAGGTSFVMGDLLAFSTSAPAMGVGSAAAALDVLIAAPLQFEFIHLVGQASPSMWAVADAKAAGAEDEKRWLHMVCEAAMPGDDTDDWVQERLADAVGFQSARVSVVAGALELVDALTGAVVVRNGAGVYVGRLSGVPVQRSPGRVGDGPLTSVLDLWPADLTEGQIEQLDLAGLITFRRFANTLSARGVYVTLGRMMAGSTSDFKLVQNRRVMDKALWLVREKGLPFLQDEADAGPDDSPGGLARFEASLQTALDEMKSAGEIADGKIIVPEGQNILSTQTIRVEVKVQPRGYMNFIDATVGFTNPALA